MSKLRFMASAIFAAAVVVCFAISATGQTEGSLANVSGGGSSARWDITAANSGGTLTINFPDGRSVRKTFRQGMSPSIMIGEKNFDALPDGVYAYELQLAPSLSAGAKEAAMKARGKDDDPESVRAGRKRLAVAGMTQSGSFTVLNGSIIVAGGVEPEQKRPAKASTGAVAAPVTRVTASDNLQQRIRNNHRAFFKPDFVIADDLVVQGSACVGLDCVNNEPFSFDTIRMKENNTRILFLDTSTSAGFPTNDWIIRANGPNSGDASFLGIVDHGNAGTGAETGTIIAQFDAGATANSLRVSSTGRVGLKTATPVLALHINESDTPDIRLEQNNSGGFSAQTWDIAGNEANFFVRDVTSGSLLPFRIRPGAPTSSIDISADGDVGIGTASPDTRLSVLGAGATFPTVYNAGEVATFVAPNDSFTVFSIVKGGIANPQGLHLGVNQASLFSEIQASRDGVATNTLSLNRQGGNVGIGTSAPTQLLSVNGTAGKPGGGSWDVFSDARLKNIKGRFNLGLKAVMQLQPLRYEYKPNNALDLKSPGEHVGFSAQEIQKVIPEAVSRSSDGFLMVNNDPILWTMLNAIKEQQRQIADLKQEVRKLRAASSRRRR